MGIKVSYSDSWGNKNAIPEEKNKKGCLYYIVIALAVLLFFAGLGVLFESDKEKALNIKVYFSGTQFEITNNDSVSYQDVVLQVNDKYEYRLNYLISGSTVQIGILNFSDDDGNRFGIMQKPKKMDIQCYDIYDKKRLKYLHLTFN